MRNIQKLANSIYTHFGSQLSRNQIVNVIGYGSGVFPQTKNNQSSNPNTIDMIITVKQSPKFHQLNIRRNPNDYQGIGSMIGTSYLQYLNKYIFPIHFNHITLNGNKIKYGIVNQNLFLQDLIDWNMLTLAGRMHKPIKPLIQLDKETEKTIFGNRRYALNVALLLLIKKQRISTIELYMKISQISYMGDIRYIANVQNVNKVQNIVQNNLQKFNQIYFPLFRELETHAKESFKFNGYDQLQVKLDPRLLHILLSKGGFPRKLYMDLTQKFKKDGYNGNLAEQFLLMGIPSIKDQIQSEIKSINRASSMKMAGNVFLGGGLMTNINYLLQKISKKGLK